MTTFSMPTDPNPLDREISDRLNSLNSLFTDPEAFSEELEADFREDAHLDEALMTDEPTAEDIADAEQDDWLSECWASQWDDDPSPYNGDYSEM